MGRKFNALALSRRERWIDTLQGASPLPFSDRLQEERYIRHRCNALASTLVAWGLFGAVASLVTQQRNINAAGQIVILCAFARFTALSWSASMPPDRRDGRWYRLVAALQLTGFPLRSLFCLACLCQSLNGLSDVEQEKLVMMWPAIFIWNCLLFPCLEQMRLLDSCLLHATTLLPASVFITWQCTGTVLRALPMLLLLVAVPIAITALLESANRARFLKLEEGSSSHAVVHANTICPDASARGSEDASPTPALPAETSPPEAIQGIVSLVTDSENTTNYDNTYPWMDKDIDDVSDEQFLAWRDKIFSERLKGLWFPITSVFLTIPDGDPDDLPADAEERLVKGFESSHPGMQVVSVTFKRGSLLVNIQIVSHVHSPGEVEEAASCLPSWQWLKWLDQPALRELYVQVEPSSSACATLLDNVPVAMLLPPLPGTPAPALRVKVGGIPAGMVLRACFQGRSMALSLEGGKGGSKEDSQPACLSVAMPAATAAHSLLAAEAFLSVPVPTAGGSLELLGLLLLEARCATTKQVVGVAPILLLPSGDADVAAELSGGRRTAGPCGEPDARGLVGSLGWWVALIRSDDYKTGNISERERQLARPTGARLFWLLITQGKVASARMLRNLLLSSGTFARLQDLNTSQDHPQKRSLLHLAVLSGNRTMVEEVLLWRSTHDLELEWTAVDGLGLTPLHLLAMNDEAAVLPWLLQSYPDALNAWNSATGGLQITPARLAKNVSRHTAPLVGPVRTRMVVRSATAVQRAERAIASNTLVAATRKAPHGPVPEVLESASRPAPGPATVSSADQFVFGPMDLLRAGVWGFADPIRESQYVAFKAIKMSSSVVLYCHCGIWMVVAYLLRFWAAGLLSSFIPINAVVGLLLRTAVISAVKDKNHRWATKLYVVAWFSFICATLTAPLKGIGPVALAAVRSLCETTLFQVRSPLAALLHVAMFISSTYYAGTVYGHNIYTVAASLVVHTFSLLVRTVVDYRCRQAFLVTLDRQPRRNKMHIASGCSSGEILASMIWPARIAVSAGRISLPRPI